MKKIIIILCITGVLFFFVEKSFALNTNDWLNKVYQESHQPAGGSGDPFASDIEADDMFNTNAALTVGPGGVDAGLSDSVFVRFARWLMRVGVMLGIPILLFGAIRIMLSRGDTGRLKEALKQTGMLLLGLLLLLGSVMIILVITSLTRSALNDFAIF